MNERMGGGRQSANERKEKKRKEDTKVKVDGKINNDNVDERRTERGR